MIKGLTVRRVLIGTEKSKHYPTSFLNFACMSKLSKGIDALGRLLPLLQRESFVSAFLYIQYFMEMDSALKEKNLLLINKFFSLRA